MRPTDALLALRALLGIDVVQVRTAKLDLAGSRDLETLLGSAVCFHLWHVTRLPDS